MSTSSTDRIVKKIELKATPARVWKALTDSKEFGQWFRVSLEGPFVPGKTARGPAKSRTPNRSASPEEWLPKNRSRSRCFSLRSDPITSAAN